MAASTFDYVNTIINMDGEPSQDVTIQSLINSIATAEASEQGILNDQIADREGKTDLGGGVTVGITVELLGNWQLKWPAGNYVAKVTEGNLVGGPSGDPIAYSAGVQQLVIQSAASTIVTTGGSALTTAESERLERIEQFARNRRETNPTTGKVELYNDLDSAVLFEADAFEDVAGTSPYDGTAGVNRRDRFETP